MYGVCRVWGCVHVGGMCGVGCVCVSVVCVGICVCGGICRIVWWIWRYVSVEGVCGVVGCVCGVCKVGCVCVMYGDLRYVVWGVCVCVVYMGGHVGYVGWVLGCVCVGWWGVYVVCVW